MPGHARSFPEQRYMVRTVRNVASFTIGLNVSSQSTPAICDLRERELEVAAVVEDTAADDDMAGKEDMVWQQRSAQERGAAREKAASWCG